MLEGLNSSFEQVSMLLLVFIFFPLPASTPLHYDSLCFSVAVLMSVIFHKGTNRDYQYRAAAAFTILTIAIIIITIIIWSHYHFDFNYE